MRKGWPLLLAGVLALAGFGGVAWLTRHPEAPVLARATHWPVVGGLAERFRDRYLPPEQTTAPEREVPVTVIATSSVRERQRRLRDAAVEDATATSGVVGAAPRVWVGPGDRLRAAPRDDAATVREVDRLAQVVYLEADGEWRRIVWSGAAGWVRERPQGEPPLGRAPAPVVPVPARPPEPATLAAAQRLLGPDQRHDRLGPYALYTDVDEPALLHLLRSLASGVEDPYRERYGLTPIGQPAEAVVLFRRCADYGAFLASEGVAAGAAGHVSRGVVALCREGRLLEEVRTTFLHEVLHLLNRRAIGPALPPWLDEGIADDLAQSRIEDGRPLPGTTAEVVVRRGQAWEVRGGLAASELLRRSLAEGNLLPLDVLLALDTGAFRAVEPPALAYAQSSFLVRFLLAGEHAPGFRAFLAAVARGEPAGVETLEGSLGVGLASLDSEYRAWLTRALPASPT